MVSVNESAKKLPGISPSRLAPRRIKEKAQHRVKRATVAQGCGRPRKVRAPMSTSMFAESEAIGTEPTGARESTLASMSAGRAGRSDVDVNVRGRGYGYTAGGCQDLLRRYKQCIAR